MRRGILLVGALAVWLGFAGLLMAQASPSGKQVTSFFSMFFVIDDMLGQIIVLVLLLMSVFIVAYVIKLFLDFRRSVMIPQALYEQVEQSIAQKRYREAIDTTVLREIDVVSD